MANRHGLKWSDAEIDKLMAMVGGHPYLLRMALFQIARNRMTLEKLLEIAPTEQGPFADHLRRHLRNLKKDDKLLSAIGMVIRADTPVKVGEEETFKLCSMGLVKFCGEGNAVLPLCDLYRNYFQDRLK